MLRQCGCIIHEHATRTYFKNIWAELSYEFGPSCLINLGRVGMGRILCGPSWHGPSWFWAELSVIQTPLLRYHFVLHFEYKLVRCTIDSFHIIRSVFKTQFIQYTKYAFLLLLSIYQVWLAYFKVQYIWKKSNQICSHDMYMSSNEPQHYFCPMQLEMRVTTLASYRSANGQF